MADESASPTIQDRLRHNAAEYDRIAHQSQQGRFHQGAKTDREAAQRIDYLENLEAAARSLLEDTEFESGTEYPEPGYDGRCAILRMKRIVEGRR